MPSSVEQDRPAPILLQNLTLPDPAICGESELYLHRDNGVSLDLEAGKVHLLEGGTAEFDGYMTLFNLGIWTRACRIEGLALRLEGEGQVALQVTRERVAGDAEILVETLVTLVPEGIRVDLTQALGGTPGTDLPELDGLLKLRLVAQEKTVLTNGAYLATDTQATRDVSLAVAITTFRREAEVAATAARMATFLDRESERLGARVHLHVIDNGGTASIPEHPHVSRIENPNLGGAGGFARGLALAQDGGFSHCLFMDDDASFQMENLTRTIAFLRLARSDRAAVSGAMVSEACKWRMWENGSVFHQVCRPQFVGTDLREPEEVAEMELAAARPKPPGFYAGWWFFAFPVAETRAFPFPFFVRGDDISFSLAHGFDTVTLSGVVSFQEDFSAKESPLTLYLDLRNHLHQHLVHPGLEIGPMGTIKVAMRFILRSVVRMHYDSAEAQLEAWEDVMRGPGFFAENADMSVRRPQISALARDEAWREVPPQGTGEPARPGAIKTQLMKFTLNGHLIPFWARFGGETAIPARQRGLIWPIWGQRAARFYDGTGRRGYEVRHDKARFMRILRRATALALRWRRAYPELREAHRKGYAEMAARPFWEARFEPAHAAPRAAAE
ncbi:MAG: glycosyl transferase [Limimaricola soesokkakensis]|uniref:glycosyl transferase n=1 Tax=Limimaricola soesokkakensis TaxID=1343159 RepID=UPI0040595787